MHKNHILACIFFKVFPCNIAKCNFVIFLFLKGGVICFFAEKQFLVCSGFTTCDEWDCVAAVKCLPVLLFSVDFIFLSFGIMDSIVEL